MLPNLKVVAVALSSVRLCYHRSLFRLSNPVQALPLSQTTLPPPLLLSLSLWESFRYMAIVLFQSPSTGESVYNYGIRVARNLAFVGVVFSEADSLGGG